MKTEVGRGKWFQTLFWFPLVRARNNLFKGQPWLGKHRILDRKRYKDGPQIPLQLHPGDHLVRKFSKLTSSEIGYLALRGQVSVLHYRLFSLTEPLNLPRSFPTVNILSIKMHKNTSSTPLNSAIENTFLVSSFSLRSFIKTSMRSLALSQIISATASS